MNSNACSRPTASEQFCASARGIAEQDSGPLNNILPQLNEGIDFITKVCSRKYILLG